MFEKQIIPHAENDVNFIKECRSMLMGESLREAFSINDTKTARKNNYFEMQKKSIK